MVKMPLDFGIDKKLLSENYSPGEGQKETAPAWYKRYHLGDYATLLHVPFASVVNAFAVIGAMMSPGLYLYRFVLAIACIQFFLQGGHYFDETKGRPWDSEIPYRNLVVIGTVLTSMGAGIGLYLTWQVSTWISIFILLAIFFVVSYNLELWGGRFHRSVWFGVSWGSLVFLGSYFI